MSEQQFINDELFKAVKRGTIDEIINLVNNCDAAVNAVDEYGCTPLMRAAYRGDNNILHFLLFKGANQAVTNKMGWTALMGAAFAGHLDTVIILVAIEPMLIFKKDEAGLTATDKAEKNRHIKIVDFLERMEIKLRPSR